MFRLRVVLGQPVRHWNLPPAIRASRLQPVSGRASPTMAIFQPSRHMFKRVHEAAHPRRAQRIAANIAKLPEVLRKPSNAV